MSTNESASVFIEEDYLSLLNDSKKKQKRIFKLINSKSRKNNKKLVSNTNISSRVNFKKLKIDEKSERLKNLKNEILNLKKMENSLDLKSKYIDFDEILLKNTGIKGFNVNFITQCLFNHYKQRLINHIPIDIEYLNDDERILIADYQKESSLFINFEEIEYEKIFEI